MVLRCGSERVHGYVCPVNPQPLSYADRFEDCAETRINEVEDQALKLYLTTLTSTSIPIAVFQMTASLNYCR